MKFKLLILVITIVFVFKNTKAQNTNSNSTWNEGMVLIKAGDYLAGNEKMTEIISQFPQKAIAYYNRGICRYYLGDQEGSCQDWNIANELGLSSNKKLVDFLCDTSVKMDFLRKNFYPNETIYPELNYRPKYTKADTLRGALRLERSCYDVYFYDLTVRLFPAKKTITGHNTIYFHGRQLSDEIQVDLTANYTIESICLNGIQLVYRREFNAIFITIPGKVIPGNDYQLTIFYSGKPRIAPNPPWDGGFIWERDKHFNRWAGVSCEHLGASSWWPAKDHLSDRPDSMSITIEAPEKYQIVCNGNLRSLNKIDKHYYRNVWFVSYPINNYNATFYMGKYTSFTDTIPLPDTFLLADYYVFPWHLEKAQAHFKQVREVVAFYNDAFGPYPFWSDNFGMVESLYEGMEHQNAIAYGEAFDNKKNSMMYLNKQYDYIIVHEAAHEWWGNSITAADMADVWLHEGFATYSEILFLEHTLGYDASIAELNQHLQYIYNVWPLVENHDVNENSFASSDVYHKGAALLQCLRATMDNDSLFKKILHDFNITYRDSTINSNHFIRFVNQYTQHDYSPLFNKYLYDSQLPVLLYTYEKSGEDLLLQYRWTGVEKNFTMPFSIETLDNNKSIRIMGTSKEQKIVLKNCKSFRFYNSRNSAANCPHNGLTFYWTSGSNPE